MLYGLIRSYNGDAMCWAQPSEEVRIIRGFIKLKKGLLRVINCLGMGRVDNLSTRSPLYRSESLFLSQYLLHPPHQAPRSTRQRANQLPEGSAGLLGAGSLVRPAVAPNLLQVNEYTLN